MKRRRWLLNSVRSVEVQVEFLENFPTRLFHIDLETRKDPGRDTVSLTQQSKQKMLSSAYW